MRRSGPFIRIVSTICRHSAHRLRHIAWSDKSIPGAGIEPARPCGQRLLRPPRLPFRHPGRVVQESIIATLWADVESYLLPDESRSRSASLIDGSPPGVGRPRSSQKGLVGIEGDVVLADGFLGLPQPELGPCSGVWSPRPTLPQLNHLGPTRRPDCSFGQPLPYTHLRHDTAANRVRILEELIRQLLVTSGKCIFGIDATPDDRISCPRSAADGESGGESGGERTQYVAAP